MAANLEEFLLSPAVWQPQSSGAAVRLKHALGPLGVYTAGSTLLRTQWEAGGGKLPTHLIDLTAIPGLDRIAVQNGELIIGATARLNDCSSHPVVMERAPLLADAIRQIAGWSVRNQATLGGNAASRVGDAVPALLALDACLVWHDGEKQYTEHIAEWLSVQNWPGMLEWVETRDTIGLRLLTSIRIPLPDEYTTKQTRRWFAYHKAGRREAFMPSLVTAAVAAEVGEDGAFADIRITAGGGRTVPLRLTEAERLLRGRRPEAAALRQVHEAVREQYVPEPDPFATDDYRKLTLANLIAAELWKRK
ncbi:FAD binding domain-containing protein [Cohnella lubricantis]|uniref:FAD binding domain-containing protein n=1 Tax=Cohnella lubricantis TaxID=2163172 RepID=A0A841TCM2_9BACL|nr:FAD binding domain-containing protein [Cohnella lubricantis]MBB6676990.1 FAD binding domain-containing protein [Cohnella lubricantis]MBP2117048.1 carbon-monoxide dehydrogenase medium subunit [Cohnella lubricantis]